jgi:hypothetical protein
MHDAGSSNFISHAYLPSEYLVFVTRPPSIWKDTVTDINTLCVFPRRSVGHAINRSKIEPETDAAMFNTNY